MTTSTVVFTDGACERNPGGRGGWGWVVDANTFGLGGDPSTTNQRMEIQAALEAVRALPRPLTVWSDSRYVVDCFQKSWWRTWATNGWVSSQKQPVKNRDLWEPFVELVAPGGVTFAWVKGHSGVDLNEVADRLANAGMLGEPVSAPLDLADGRRGHRGRQERRALRGHCHVECTVQGVRGPLQDRSERHEERDRLGARGVRSRITGCTEAPPRRRCPA